MNAFNSDIAVAVYDLHAGAVRAVQELQGAGFNVKRISIIGSARIFGALGAFWSCAGTLTADLAAIGIPGDSVQRYATALRANKFMLVIRGDMRDVNRASELLAISGHERFDRHHVREETPVHVLA